MIIAAKYLMTGDGKTGRRCLRIRRRLWERTERLER